MSQSQAQRYDKFYLSFYRFVKAVVTTFAQPVQRDKPPNVAPYMVWGSKALNVAYTTIYSQYSGKAQSFVYQVRIMCATYQSQSRVVHTDFS